jgi:hypothetical protein
MSSIDTIDKLRTKFSLLSKSSDKIVPSCVSICKPFTNSFCHSADSQINVDGYLPLGEK